MNRSDLADILLVIDVQNGLNQAARFDDVVKDINQRIDQYRSAQRALLFVQNCDEGLVYGSSSWQFAPTLARQSGDRVLGKYHSDVFFETGLDVLLKHAGVQTIEVCGLQTEYCIDTAFRVGHDYGYKMQIVHGLHTTFDTPTLSAAQMLKHHEHIWDGSFGWVLSAQ